MRSIEAIVVEKKLGGAQETVISKTVPENERWELVEIIAWAEKTYELWLLVNGKTYLATGADAHDHLSQRLYDKRLIAGDSLNVRIKSSPHKEIKVTLIYRRIR
ncbi:MAG: hypothetical protein DRJ03_17045 [Chloroflexi bacterium]|nr:MAG: hypothetical protein DRJ03_17045 [Chloroflexota bacterium]